MGCLGDIFCHLNSVIIWVNYIMNLLEKIKMGTEKNFYLLDII